MHKKPVAVLISGNGSNLQALIDACKKPDFPARIALVISNKTDAYGLIRAIDAGIPTRVILHRDCPDKDEFDAALHAALVESEVEIVCLAGFMRILTAPMVAQWEGKMINIHPSLLPAFKGMHTHEQVIAGGIKIHGCTVHYVVPEVDAGPIIAQAAIAVKAGDTIKTLSERVLAMEHLIYPLALHKLINPSLKLDTILDNSQKPLISF